MNSTPHENFNAQHTLRTLSHLDFKRAIQAISACFIALNISLPLAAEDDLKFIGPAEILDIAVDAYIYGYPLVTFDTVRQQQTNVATADAEHAPMGQMIKMRSYPAVDNHCCAAPNADTLYTILWLDITQEPWVFNIPDMSDRYYMMPMLDGWSEVFEVAGSRTTGGKAQSYAITGPNWSGSLPAGVKQVKSSTNMVWILGRIYSTGTAEDYKAVHALQDKFSAFPLSSYGKPYHPAPSVVDPSVDMKTSVRKQVDAMDVNAYFTRLAELMKSNPPTEKDAEIVEMMAKIGLLPGQNFNPTKLSFLDQEIIKTVPKLALADMGLYLKEQKTTNGWLYFTNGVGNFGTNYRLRGMANLLGPGWNRPQDAVYPLSQKDANGDKYDASKYNYVIRFEKGELPPAKAFWSLTMYDKDLFFVPNSLNRYDLASRDKLKVEGDGSVIMYFQATTPGKDKEANWLPAPKGEFMLVMRIYSPTKAAPSVIDGSWTPPPVTREKLSQ